MMSAKRLSTTTFSKIAIVAFLALAVGSTACSFETPGVPINPPEDAAVIETDATPAPDAAESDAMEPDAGGVCGNAGTDGCPCVSTANCAQGFACNANNRCEGPDAGFAPDAAEPDATEPDAGFPDATPAPDATEPDAGFADATVVTTDAGICTTPNGFGCICSTSNDCLNGLSCQFGICLPNPDASVPDADATVAPDTGTPDAGATCSAPRAIGCGCFNNTDCDSANCDQNLCVSAIPDAGFPDAGFADATVVTTDAGICTTPNGFGCICSTSNDCLNGLSCQFGICLPNPDASVPDVGFPDSGTPDSGFADAAQQDAAAADATTPDVGIPDAGFAPDATVAPDSGTSPACTAGTIDCECNVDGTCDFGTLECRQVLISYATLQVASRCVPNDCPDGDVGCPCRSNGTCGTGLVCLATSSYIGYPPVYYCALTPDAGISDTGVHSDATVADSGTTDATVATTDATVDGGTIADASADAAVDGGTTPDSGADAGTLPPLNTGITVISSTVTPITLRIRWVATAAETAVFPVQLNQLDMYVECQRTAGGLNAVWAVYATNSRLLPDVGHRLERGFTFAPVAGETCKMNVQAIRSSGGAPSFWAASDQNGQQTVVGHFEADVPGYLRGSSITVVRHTSDPGYDFILSFAP